MKVYIVYEVYNREYDNCLLLQSALNHEGFDAEIVYKMDLLKIPSSMERRILIIPNCYNDENFKYYYYTSGCGNALIINLQYEQVLSKDKDNIKNHIPCGRAKYLYNLCWGKNFRKFLIDAGLDESKCILGGALQLDFFKYYFKDFWVKKEDLLSRYCINKNSEISLFISSFAYADNAFVNRAYDKDYGKNKIEDFKLLSHKSRERIIDWFESFLKTNSKGDKIIIYRKHPMEKYNDRLVKLAQQYRNSFYLIDDYNIKQWIFVADRIINWYSTSAVECVVAGKPFEILRPFKIDENKDMVLFEKARFVTDYEDFANIMYSDCKNITYPFDVKKINDMYLTDSIPAFDRIVRWIRSNSIKAQNESYIDENYISNRRKYIFKNKLRVKYLIKKIYQLLHRKFRISIKSKILKSRFAIDDWEFQSDLQPDNVKKSSLEKLVDSFYAQKTNGEH